MEKITYLNLRSFEKRLKEHGWTIGGYLTSDDIIIVIAEKNFHGYIVKKKFNRVDLKNHELDEYQKN